VYAQRGGALVRATAAGPLDPCAANLSMQTLVPVIASLTVTSVAAAALPVHTDPISGNVDGGLFVPAGITELAVDSHATDLGGAPIATGNDVVEVTIAADPAVTPIDLVAGNRPSSYTQVLAYTCNGRCEATAPFPEIRGGAYTDCTPGYDFQNTAAYYVPASYGFVGQRVVITSYDVSGGYTFAFSGPAPANVERAWGVAIWPPPASPLSGTIADPYPLDYGANAVVARGVAQLASDLGEPAAFTAELSACADMQTDQTYHD